MTTKNNPSIGDRYSANAKDWIHIINENPLIVEHYTFPCEVPADRKVEYVGTVDKFEKQYGDYNYVDNTAPVGHICRPHNIGGTQDHTELLNEKWRIMIEAHNELDLCVESKKPVPKRYMKFVMGKLTNAVAEVQDHLGKKD